MQPDAATRPQDQADFDIQTHLNATPIYTAARLMRNPSGVSFDMDITFYKLRTGGRTVVCQPN
jgi:hypothetical protein